MNRIFYCTAWLSVERRNKHLFVSCRIMCFCGTSARIGSVGMALLKHAECDTILWTAQKWKVWNRPFSRREFLERVVSVVISFRKLHNENFFCYNWDALHIDFATYQMAPLVNSLRLGSIQRSQNSSASRAFDLLEQPVNRISLTSFTRLCRFTSTHKTIYYACIVDDLFTLFLWIKVCP
jgi:hypothetical protein